MRKSKKLEENIKKLEKENDIWGEKHSGLLQDISKLHKKLKEKDEEIERLTNSPNNMPPVLQLIMLTRDLKSLDLDKKNLTNNDRDTLDRVFGRVAHQYHFEIFKSIYELQDKLKDTILLDEKSQKIAQKCYDKIFQSLKKTYDDESTSENLRSAIENLFEKYEYFSDEDKD